VEVEKMKTFTESCEDMTKLIESCWDSNNPDDGRSFDERLADKMANLEGMDLKVIHKVIGW
jgi:hypothetical protein